MTKINVSTVLVALDALVAVQQVCGVGIYKHEAYKDAFEILLKIVGQIELEIEVKP